RDEHALQLYWEYSLCLYKLGECAEALSMVEQGLSQYPDCRELYYIKGQIYYEMGMLRHSQEYFLKFIAIKTSFLKYTEGMAVNYKAYGYLTAISVRDGKCEEALYYLQLFVKANPDISILKKLCLLLLKSGIDEHTLIEILVTSDLISELALVQLLLMSREYGACLDVIKHFGKENEFHLEWMQCQLHLGRYNQVQHMIDGTIPPIPMGRDTAIYYCVSRCLENPRQSSREFLLKLDRNLPEVQACLWIEELIFKNTNSPVELSDINVQDVIKKIALTIYTLGDTCLAFDIIQNCFSYNRQEAYTQLGREAFANDFFKEAKTLLERSLSQEDEKAEDYYKLGIVCGGLGLYEQALEYLLRAAALNSENQIYPCLVYEFLAIYEIEILVKKLDSFIENLSLKNELLRLCTLKCKSKRLRQLIEQQGNDGRGAAVIYNHFDIWSLVNDRNEEAE
ncbi:MAG: hypothetical protein PHZ03_00530, partial [Syntrophomonas sp.]|nr:hypothetical protein [Syntrophomonas sp.]